MGKGRAYAKYVILNFKQKPLRFVSSNELFLVRFSEGIVVIPNQLHLQEKKAEKGIPYVLKASPRSSLKKPEFKFIFSVYVFLAVN